MLRFIVRKKGVNKSGGLLLEGAVLLIILVIAGKSIGYGGQKTKVLGDNSDFEHNNSGWGLNINNGNSSQSAESSVNTNLAPDTQTTVTPTETLTPIPTQTINESSLLAAPTETPNTPIPTPTLLIPTETLQPTVSIPSNNFVNTESTPVNVYKTEKTIISTPIMERSVVSNNLSVYPTVVKQNVFETIQLKIQQVGRGEFLSKPTPTPTVEQQVAKSGSAFVDILTGDVDVYYKFQNGNVMLSAQNSDNQKLNIKEEDLRGAEITMARILNKKQISLNVTNNNLFALVQGDVTAVTSTPIHINIDSHKIYLEIGGEKKELKILPSEAVKEAVDLKYFEKLNSNSVPSIEKYGDELAYKVVGDKHYKVFGFIKVTAKENVYVTAESGEVISGDQPWITRVIRIISL